jgi:hypothetical protein
LEPYTQYAFYVKAYTLATEQKGAQSDINYFTTKPDQPQRVKKLKATPLGPDKIVNIFLFNFNIHLIFDILGSDMGHIKKD